MYNSNEACENISVDASLTCRASSTVGPPLIKSSTCRLLSISSTIFCDRFNSSLDVVVPHFPCSRNGNGPSRNNARVDRKVSTRFDCKSAIQWKRRASLASSLILACDRHRVESSPYQYGPQLVLQWWSCMNTIVQDGALSKARGEAS